MTGSQGPDFADQTDFANARRGLIDRLDPCVVVDDRGRTVWDNEKWGFLEGPCPQTVHPSLWRQGRLNSIDGLFEVVPGVYQVRGLDASNMTLIEGAEGVILIDPLVSRESAAAALGLYRRNRGDRPVTAVVYTHSHGDHFGGVLGVTSPERVAAGECAVVAPEGFLHHAVSENVFAGPAMHRRAAYMYGRPLPVGPTGQVGFGLAQGVSSGTMGLLPPTETVDATGQELVLDGVRLVFQLTPDTEAPAEMNLYLPDRRVLLIAENASHTLHNVLTLRGAVVRDTHAWAGYLTEGLQLFDEAEVLIGSHHWPTWGREEVARLIGEQRDAYAYLHDQTVRLMNRGLTGAEIAEELAEFPGELGRAWSVRGYYGTLSHNVKAVYQRYMGWYDGNPAHLWQHPPVEQAKRYVAAFGGPDATTAQAMRAVEAGDLRWAAELLGHVLFADPGHAPARELQAQTFERLGRAQEAGTWRNIYLTGAHELRAYQQGAPEVPALAMETAEMFAGLTTRQAFELLAVRLDGPRAAAGHRLLLRWEFTDTGETWTVQVANGVLTPLRGDAPGGEKPQLTLWLTRHDLNLALAWQTPLPASAAAGTVRTEGDLAALDALDGLLERPLRDFPVVLP